MKCTIKLNVLNTKIISKTVGMQCMHAWFNHHMSARLKFIRQFFLSFSLNIFSSVFLLLFEFLVQFAHFFLILSSKLQLLHLYDHKHGNGSSQLAPASVQFDIFYKYAYCIFSISIFSFRLITLVQHCMLTFFVASIIIIFCAVVVAVGFFFIGKFDFNFICWNYIYSL